MTASYADMQVNPFEDDIVREPRDVSFSVADLNDVPLNRLLAKVEALDPGELPRSSPVKADKAQLVISPDRGYGKSHLLGRLFAALGRRATKVYLRPFQAPDRAWQSILMLTLQELERPDDETPGVPTQLQALAIGTLAHIVADFAEDGVPGRPDVTPAVPLLRELAAGSLPETAKPRLTDWLRNLFADAVPMNRLSGRLKNRRIDLYGREKAWLKVLAICALDDPISEARSAALKWLRGEPLESEEVVLLRLEQADNEGRGDSSAQEINQLSFRRLQGLCQLASYYRPFVFCFDQTEFYASDPALIKTLGNCIDQLYVDLSNHLTVVTANQANWVTDILPHMAAPQQQRLSAEIRLEGIGKQGARELITERLKACGLAPDRIARFFDDDWLDRVFTPLPELGVRALLMRAAERFQALARPNKPPAPQPSLADLFQLEVNGVRSKTALQAYNQDCLMWFAKDIGQAMSGVTVGRTVGLRYFSLAWDWPDRRVCFAFEGGDHWRRWKSIADEALRMAGARGDRAFLAYVFRTPDLARVPRKTWATAQPTFDEASKHGFRIVELTSDRVCELHGARELYSNALQGNIVYSGTETLAWLQKHFAPFLKDIALASASAHPKEDRSKKAETGPPKQPQKPPARQDALDGERLQLVLDVVREHRIIDISAVLARLGNDDLRDPLLRSVEVHPNLRAHPGPQTIFLQWRITA
ncbi:MAG TPA: hypothetical protein VMM15_22310 [Bradyrhizobium sp.]|nr:hypothetical protein [Bradyrhizobium sp.]